MSRFCEGLKEVRNGTQVALTLVLNLSLTQCKPHPISLLARHSGLFRPVIMISWLPHFILVRVTREKIVQVLLALQIAGRLAGFLMLVVDIGHSL